MQGLHGALIGDGRGGVFCENSLLAEKDWHPVAQSKIKLGTFDVLLTNPPFGTKIPIKGAAVLAQYELGYKCLLDEVPHIVERYRLLLRGAKHRDHLGFFLMADEVRNRILVPKYYDPEIEAELKSLSATPQSLADWRFAKAANNFARHGNRNWKDGLWNWLDPVHSYIRSFKLGNQGGFQARNKF